MYILILANNAINKMTSLLKSIDKPLVKTRILYLQSSIYINDLITVKFPNARSINFVII